jgi:pimeloyl-ACP methyl ester carboxylesterase
MAIWVVVADRTVKWGKAEEEERLTGRPETRRTALEWVEVTFASVALLILALVSLLLTISLIIRALDAAEVYPGHRYWVDGGKYRIHVYCHGSKSRERLPTVLFEGGEDPVENGLWQFAEEAVKHGSFHRYCFADRPGLAWSDTSPSPMSAGQATDALSEALAWAGEVGPWVLVSAGIGSIYSRVFSSRHGAEVIGMLLIDPLHEDLLYRVQSPQRGFSLWLRGIFSPLGLDRIPGAIFKGRSKADRIWGRSAYQSGKFIFAKLQENLVADTLTKRDVISARAIQYQDTPITIISSGKQIRDDDQWERKQRDLTKITTNLTHWDIVDEAPHRVWDTQEGRDLIEKRLKRLVHARPHLDGSYEEEQSL